MKIIDPGHVYLLRMLDSPKQDSNVLLTFVKREGEGYPGNVGHHKGTNLQEVLRALIDRIKYLDNQIHDIRNDQVLHYLRSSILQLEMRAAERHGRKLPIFDMDEIELQPVCGGCGHIGCKGCERK